MVRVAMLLGLTLAVAACATRGTPPTQTCPDGSMVPVTVPCPPPPPPPPPATMACPDGTVVQVGYSCPVPPPPPPPPPNYRRSGERG
jgi:hypothetical protein